MTGGGVAAECESAEEQKAAQAGSASDHSSTFHINCSGSTFVSFSMA